MTMRYSRTLAIFSGTAALLALAAFSPSTLAAQDSTAGKPQTPASRESTMLPTPVRPLFHGIKLTAEQNRQVAMILQRRDSTAAGRINSPQSDTRPTPDSTSTGMGAGVGPMPMELTSELTSELRAILTSSADKATFDRNVAQVRSAEHGPMKDSTYTPTAKP